MPTRKIDAQRIAIVAIGFIVLISAVYAISIKFFSGDQKSKIASLSQDEHLKMVSSQELKVRNPTVTPLITHWGKLNVLETTAETYEAGNKTDYIKVNASKSYLSDSPALRRQRSPHQRDRWSPNWKKSKRAKQRPLSKIAEERGGVMAKFKAPEEPVVVEAPMLPEVPTRHEISRAMGSIRSSAQQCYDTGMVPGDVMLTLTVNGQTGKVAQASVSDTSSTATCLKKLANSLRFPKFSRDTITIRYPYSFK